MSHSQPAPRRRRTRTAMFAALVAVALTGVVGCRSLAGSSSAVSPTVAVRSAHLPQERLRGDVPGGLPGLGQGEHHHELGVADGEVPDGVTVFDDEYPAVARLDPALLGALRRAAEDAAGDGVVFSVNSAGVPRRTRSSCSMRRSRSMARERRLPAGWPLRLPPVTCWGTRLTSDAMPRPGFQGTALSTGCARSTATSPGTTSCVPKPLITGALRCTPIPRTIRGCSSDGALDRVPPRGTAYSAPRHQV
jgi:hypothetical protein